MDLIWAQTPTTKEKLAMATSAFENTGEDDREDSFIVLDNTPSLTEYESEEASSTLSEEVAIIKNENASLKEDLQKNSDLIKKQQVIFQAWKSDKERMLALYKESYEEYKRTCEQLQQQNASLTSTLEECKVLLEEKEKLIAKLGQEIEELDVALKNESKELDEEKAQRAQLHSECEAATKLVDKLQSDVFRLTKESECLTTLKEEMQARMKMLEEKLKENSIIVEETDNFTLIHRPHSLNMSQIQNPIISSPQEAELQEEQMRASLLMQQLAEERLQVINLQKQLNEKDNFVAALKMNNHLESIAKETDTTSICPNDFDQEKATSIIVKLQEEVTTLQNLLKLERQKRSEENNQIEELEKKIQDLFTQNKELKEIVEPLPNESECRSQQCRALYSIQAKSYQESLDQLTARCFHAEQLIESYRSSNEQILKEVKDMREKNEAYQSEVNQLRNEMDRLQTEKVKADAELERLKPFAPMAEELPIVKEQLAASKKELEEKRILYEEAKKNNEELQNLLNDIFKEEEKESKGNKSLYEWEEMDTPSQPEAATSSSISHGHRHRSKHPKSYKRL